MKGKSRWIKLEDVDDDEFLKTGWDDMEGEHIQGYVESNTNGWTADQVSFLTFVRTGNRIVEDVGS